MKIFKFKKHKDGYEDGTRGTTPRYPLEIKAFFDNQVLGRPAECSTSAMDAGTSLSTPSSSAAPLTMGLPSDALTVGTSTRDAPEGAELSTSLFEATRKGKMSA